MNKQQQKKIVQYLNEAHATELALARDLQAQIAMTPRGSYRDGLERHLDETRRHSRQVETAWESSGRDAIPLELGVGVVEAVAGQMVRSPGHR